MDLAVCQRVVLYLDNMYPTVEIHGDDVVSASAGQQVRDQGTGLSNPLAVSDLGLESRRLGGCGCAREETWGWGSRAVGAIGFLANVEVGRLVGFVRLARVDRLGTLDAVLLDGARGVPIGMAAVALIHLHPTELVVQRCRAIGYAGAFSLAWEGRLRSRVERVCAGPRAPRYLGKGRASLVVWNVRLPRVGKEWKDGGDALRRGGTAGGDGNEKSVGRSGTSLNYTMRMGLLHQMVVDCAQHEH